MMRMIWSQINVFLAYNFKRNLPLLGHERESDTGFNLDYSDSKGATMHPMRLHLLRVLEINEVQYLHGSYTYLRIV